MQKNNTIPKRANDNVQLNPIFLWLLGCANVSFMALKNYNTDYEILIL